MKQFALVIGTIWIIVAIWYDSGLNEHVLWAGLLPTVWLLSLGFLRT